MFFAKKPHDYDTCKKGVDCQDCRIHEKECAVLKQTQAHARSATPTKALHRKAFDAFKNGGATGPVLALLLGVCLLTLAGCIPSHAIKLIETSQAANKGHMQDEGLPPQAREIAQDNYDEDSVLLELLDDRDLPADTALRIAESNGARVHCAMDVYPHVDFPRWEWQEVVMDYGILWLYVRVR